MGIPQKSRYLYFLGHICYTIIQFFNPNLNTIIGYLAVNRRMFTFVAAYLLVAYFYYRDRTFLRSLTRFWMGLAFVLGLYGCFQEWHGFLPFEWKVISMDEGLHLIFIDGRFRKFSLFPDPTSFGIFMAISGLYALVQAVGPYGAWKRILFVAMAAIMFLGMAYSGTRTAYAMIPAGFSIFALMTVTNRQTLLMVFAFIFVGIFILFAPIYGNKTINRIRSTFQGGDDPSMNVRNVNRKRIQPYIYSHPMGGGIATTGVFGEKYDPQHVLAGFPPDSGLLQIALETGWIGLAISMLFYFVILQTTIRRYYHTHNPKQRSYFLGIAVALFALCIAQYSQAAIGPLPTSIIFYALISIIGQKEPKTIN